MVVVPEKFKMPEDLSAVSDEDIAGYLQSIQAEAAELLGGEATAEIISSLSQLAQHKAALEGAMTQRDQDRAKLSAQFDELRGQFSVAAEGDTGDAGSGQEESGQQSASQPALAASGRPAGGARTGPRELGGVDGPGAGNLNQSLREMSLRDLAAKTGNQAPKGTPALGRSVLVTSSDVPSHPMGSELAGYTELVDAVQRRARAMSVTALGVQAPRAPVASLQRTFRHTLDLQTDPAKIDQILQEATDPDVLVAAGGWCSPSEISYDFYQIICADGMVDIPTTGINRGGMRWPTSPSFADISALQNWTWTETMDIAAATGTGMSGTKPCVRVPCAGFNEERLACDGICVTAGNLTVNAWPEQIANYLRMVEASHAHYMNSRIINRLVGLSTALDTTEAANSGASWALLDSAAFVRRHLIEKFNMCNTAVIETVFPRYAIDLIRADLALRTGVSDMMAVSDAMIADWFDTRKIRAQFVSDYQVRGTSQFGAASAPVTWPTQTNYLAYPAGTFVKGLGMTLDLGVVRDSTLNQTNDHTAAWMEECYLIAMIGHISYNVAVTACATGAAGQALTAGCNI